MPKQNLVDSGVEQPICSQQILVTYQLPPWSPTVVIAFRFPRGKVAIYRHVYRAEPKEPTLFGSVSGSEIQNLPFSHSGIVSLYRSEPKEPT